MTRLAPLAVTIGVSFALSCGPTPAPPADATSSASPAPSAAVGASPSSTQQATPPAVPGSPTPAATSGRVPIPGLGTDTRIAVTDCVYPGCIHWAIAAGREVALITTLRRRTESQFDSDFTLIDQATGTQRLVRHGAGALVPGRVGGSLFTYVESNPASGGSFGMTWRAYERDWRAGTERILDETTSDVCPTGECWTPSPNPVTNGAQTAWLRPVSASGQVRFDLVLTDRGAPGRAIYTTTSPFFFDLDDQGRMAIGTFSSTTAELLVYDNGRVRSLMKRQLDAAFNGGRVGFSGGKIVWSVGWGPPGSNAISSVDLIDPATAVSKRVERAPCSYAGSTSRHVAFACSDGAFLYDSVDGKFIGFAANAPGTFGPGSFGLQASPEALWLPELRERYGPNASVRSWIVTPVVP